MITLKVSIPANTTGLVYLPAPDPLKVKEGSMEAGRSPGVHYRGKEKDTAFYEIASGRYEFVFGGLK